MNEQELTRLVNDVLTLWEDPENPRHAQWAALDKLTAVFTGTGTIPGALQEVTTVVRQIDEHVREVDNGFARFSGERLGSMLTRLRQARDDIGIVPAEVQRQEQEEEQERCPETWAELFQLDPPVNFQQLMRMKRCNLETIYAQARLHEAIEHLPPGEREAAIERKRAKEADEKAEAFRVRHAVGV